MFEKSDKKRIKPSRLFDVQALEPYVNQAWNAETELGKLSDINVLLFSENLHLWNSDEQTQTLAVATWIAGIRQELGERLLYHGQESSGKRYVVANDIAEHAGQNLRSTQAWLTYIDKVRADDEYVLTEDIHMGYAWEKLGDSVSKPMLNAIYKTVYTLFYVDFSHAKNAYTDTRALPAEFKSYLHEMSEAEERLGLEMSALERLWQDNLDPNAEAGRMIYERSAKLIEGIIRTGAHMLMPRLGNPNLRLVNPVRKRPVTQQGNLKLFKPLPPPVLPVPPNVVEKFDPGSITRPRPARIKVPENTVPQFDPTKIEVVVAKPDPPPIDNKVEQFAIENLAAVREASAEEVITSVPAFDASQIIPRINRVPVFDPSAVLESDQEDEDHIPIFDPAQLKLTTPLPPTT